VIGIRREPKWSNSTKRNLEETSIITISVLVEEKTHKNVHSATIILRRKLTSNCRVLTINEGRRGFKHTTYQVKTIAPETKTASSIRSVNERLDVRNDTCRQEQTNNSPAQFVDNKSYFYGADRLVSSLNYMPFVERSFKSFYYKNHSEQI
jgi:hypothetical protein